MPLLNGNLTTILNGKNKNAIKSKIKTLKTKSSDLSNLSFFVPNFVVTRLGVEPRTY